MMLGFDLDTWLQQAGGIHATHGDERVVPCTCDAGKDTAHLWVNVHKHKAICYRCGIRHGEAVGILAQVGSMSLEQATLLVRRGQPHDLVWHRMREALKKGMPDQSQPEGPLPEIYLPPEYQPIDRAVPAYARGRGITLETAKLYHVGLCSGGFYGGRLIVPVHDAQKRLVSFVARLMGSDSASPKVLYPAGTKTGQLLFSEHRAAAYDGVVVTEGVFDAIRVGACAVALFGKQATRHQVDRLVALGESRRLVIMLDDDAQQEARSLAQGLARRGGCEVWVARMPIHRHDPGECTAEEIAESVASAYRIGHRATFLQVSMGLAVPRIAVPRRRDVG